jgi:hypothetical protein
MNTDVKNGLPKDAVDNGFQLMRNPKNVPLNEWEIANPIDNSKSSGYVGLFGYFKGTRKGLAINAAEAHDNYPDKFKEENGAYVPLFTKVGFTRQGNLILG